MAIDINSGFEIGSPQPLDSRNVLSKSDMININENIWPSIYYTMCKDDGKMYIFNKDNEINEDTGKFRIATKGCVQIVELTREEYNSLNDELKSSKDFIYYITDSIPNGNIQVVSMTKAEYDLLRDEEKSSEKILYYIVDVE